MAVITISRQLGSQGTTVGRLVASRLGYRVVKRELINQAARQVSSPAMALAIIDELGLLGIETDESQQQAYLQAVKEVMGTLVEEGNVVIVGRAGQVILHDRPNVLHVRVIAPRAVRIQRIVKAHHITKKAASAQIEDSDRYRADYLQKYYHVQWDSPDLYHLVINTGKLDLETSAEVVCTAVHKLPNQPPSKEFLHE